MKTFLRLLAFAVCIFSSNLCAADVLYSFSGLFAGNDSPATFQVRLPDFIDHDLIVSGSDAVSCSTGERACFDIQFYLDAHAHGASQDSVPFIILSELDDNLDKLGFYYYFPEAAFASAGVYSSLYGFNPATLTVSGTVPEPASILYFLSGVLLIAGIRAQKRR